MAYFSEKIYNSGTDRLFLVYYALPENLINANGWGVSSETIDENIRKFEGIPVTLKQKDPNVYMDRIQEGEFVHAYAMKGATLQQQFEYQKPYTVGVIRSVKLNPAKGYRFELEILDEKAKRALVDEDAIEKYPKWVSPVVASSEEGLLKNWTPVQLSFVDKPAYGFEKMKPAGICQGAIDECTIKLQGASMVSGDCGFCMKSAMQKLIGASVNSVSSQSSQSTNSSTEMVNSSSGVNQGTVTTTTTYPSGASSTDSTFRINKASEQGQKIEPDQTNTDTAGNPSGNTSPQSGDTTQQNNNQINRPDPDSPDRRDNNSDASREATIPRNYEEAVAAWRSAEKRFTEFQVSISKEFGEMKKFVADAQKKEAYATLKTLIPREAYKTEKSYNDALDEGYDLRNKGVSDDLIKELFEGRALQTLKVRGASVLTEDRYAGLRSIPDYKGASEIAKSAVPDDISSDNERARKNLELLKMFGGTA